MFAYWVPACIVLGQSFACFAVLCDFVLSIPSLSSAKAKRAPKHAKVSGNELVFRQLESPQEMELFPANGRVVAFTSSEE